MPPQRIPERGLLNVRGRVTPAVVEIEDHYEVHWVCPECHENIFIDAMEFVVNWTIEDGRTAFGHCSGRDYAIILPKLLPVKFWEKYPRSLH